MRCVAIIPCRFASTRFPGKPLAEIAGMPMLWHVHERVKESGAADAIFIATDDDRISSCCHELGLQVLMTGQHHFTGTDRVAEASLSVDADCIVNVQGDEPLIHPSAIKSVVDALVQCHDSDVAATNGFALLEAPAEIESKNVVKVVTSRGGFALGYSRLPIPYPRSETPTYKRQLGLYCFRKSALALFAKLEPGPLERAESVEMYRFLEADLRVRMVEVRDESIPVDTPEDLEIVRTRLMALQSRRDADTHT